MNIQSAFLSSVHFRIFLQNLSPVKRKTSRLEAWKQYVFDQFEFLKFFPVFLAIFFLIFIALPFGFLSKLYGFLASNLKLFC